MDDALQGAADIIAEMVSDSATLRKTLRNFLLMHGILKTEGKPGADPVYDMYDSYSEPVSKIASHRVLAIDRGVKGFSGGGSGSMPQNDRPRFCQRKHPLFGFCA